MNTIEYQDIISKALRKLDGTLGKVTMAASMTEPGSLDAARLEQAEEYISRTFDLLEQCKGGITSRFATMGPTPAEPVNRVTVLDKLSLLLDEVYKVRTVCDEVMFWFDAMPAKAESAERLMHCAYGADRAGILIHVTEDKLDDMESMIDRFTSELTNDCKCCKMGVDE